MRRIWKRLHTGGLAPVLAAWPRHHPVSPVDAELYHVEVCHGEGFVVLIVGRVRDQADVTQKSGDDAVVKV